jgi:hypothetical protein
MDKKEISARKYMTIIFSTTYCLIMFGLTIALLIKLIRLDTYIACLASFVLIVREISEAYFKREDRQTPVKPQEVAK